MRIPILLLTLVFSTTLSAQIFRWNKSNDTQARTPQAAASDDPLIDETGDALFYADYFEGNPTALGETYHHHLMTAAHPKLPLGTIVKVTRLDNGLVTTVRINDRGAYCDNCVIDLSRAAAQQIDLLRVGRARVALTVLGYSNTNPPTPNAYQPPEVSSHLTARRPEASQTYTISSGNPYNHVTAESRTQARSADAGLTQRGLTTPPQPQPAPSSYNTIPVRQPEAASNAQTTPAPARQVNILTEPLYGYAVQLGSYSQIANAERHVMTLQDRGFNSLFVLQQARGDGSVINRVIVAPFKSIREAEDYLGDLRRYQQMEGLIIRMQ